MQNLATSPRTSSLGEVEGDDNPCGVTLAAALAATQAFDTSIGMDENSSKRQSWRAGDATPIEHLGLRVVYDRPDMPIVPKDEWAKYKCLVQRIRFIPGTILVREKLAQAYIVPMTTWAGPLFSDPPDLSRELMCSIIKTSNDWWCLARWYADRISLHLVLGTAARGLLAANSILEFWSLHSEYAIGRHVAVLDLQYNIIQNKLWFSPSDNCDHRVHTFVTSLGIGGSFQAGSAGGDHAIRLAARAKALNSFSHWRHDTEGMGADLHVQSHRRWTLFYAQLSTEDASLIRIYRGSRSHANSVLPWQSVYCGTRCHCLHLLWLILPFGEAFL